MSAEPRKLTVSGIEAWARQQKPRKTQLPTDPSIRLFLEIGTNDEIMLDRTYVSPVALIHLNKMQTNSRGRLEVLKRVTLYVVCGEDGRTSEPGLLAVTNHGNVAHFWTPATDSVPSMLREVAKGAIADADIYFSTVR